MTDQPIYAIPLDLSQEDLDIDKSFLSGDFEESELINEDLYDSMSFYYGEVRAVKTCLAKCFLYPKRL